MGTVACLFLASFRPSVQKDGVYGAGYGQLELYYFVW